MPPDESDSSLLARAACDPSAFDALYARYLDRVFAFVASRVRCRAEAEDFVSDIWIRILGALPRFQWRHEASVPAWIFRIARNVLIDAERKRRIRGDAVDVDEMVDILPDDAATPADHVDKALQFLQAQRLIDGLPPQQGRCIRLRFYAGLQNRDIARIEGLSEKTVASHISRAIATLRAATDDSSLSAS